MDLVAHQRASHSFAYFYQLKLIIALILFGVGNAGVLSVGQSEGDARQDGS